MPLIEPQLLERAIRGHNLNLQRRRISAERARIQFLQEGQPWAKREPPGELLRQWLQAVCQIAQVHFIQQRFRTMCLRPDSGFADSWFTICMVLI